MNQADNGVSTKGESLPCAALGNMRVKTCPPQQPQEIKDPEANKSDNEAIQSERRKKPARRCKTHAGSFVTNLSIHEKEPHIPPEALVELHALHEEFLQKKSTNGRVDDTSEKALNNIWARPGSWQLYPMLPEISEAAMHERSLTLCPKALASNVNVKAHLAEQQLGVLNTKGKKYPQGCIGQDSCSFSHFTSGWELVCVMDGHGRHGHWPAARAVRTLPFFLQGSICEMMLASGSIESALLRAFEKTQEDLVQQARAEDVDLQASGSTGTVIMWHPEKKSLWVATIGDSRAIMLAPGQGVVRSTVDHKPNVAEEKQRVEAEGGEIVWEEYEEGWIAGRVNIKGKSHPGLSMTRSFGDMCLKTCGVIAKPEVVQWPWPEEKGAMILAASDGVWEFLDNDIVAKMVLDDLEKSCSLREALKHLCQEARDAWAREEAVYCDDITAILAPLEPARDIAPMTARDERECVAGMCKNPGCNLL